MTNTTGVPNRYSEFACDTAEVVQKPCSVAPSDWRLLRRLELPAKFNDPNGGEVRRALVVDVETTGLNVETDDVTQLAMLQFEYEVETGLILTVYRDHAFEELREPNVPISEEASLITGITADMVAGKEINADSVDALVETSDLVIAHNATFDRPMVEKHWTCFEKKPWACSYTGVDWLRHGFSAGKLDYLGMQFGWFYEGHRALADCEACLALLAQALPNDGARVMTAVRRSASKTEWLIRAVGSPYERKDVLKARGYKWRGDGLPHGRVWWTIVEDTDAEVAWLSEEVYGREISLNPTPVTALTKYSERLWEF